MSRFTLGVITCIVIVLAFGQSALAGDNLCDGRPLPALQRAACREALQKAWGETVEAEARAESELSQLGGSLESARGTLGEHTQNLRYATAKAAGARASAAKADKSAREASARALLDEERAVQAAQHSVGEWTLKVKQLAKEVRDASTQLDSLRGWLRRVPSIVSSYDVSDAYETNHCERPLMLCLDRTGELISAVAPAESVPSLRVGDKLVVLVLTPNLKRDRDLVTVVFHARKSIDTAFPRDSVAASKATREFAADLESVAFEPIPFPSEPVPDDAEDLTISFQRKPAAGEHGAENQIVIPVDRGRSYYSVGLLVATTFKGDRRVLRDLDVVEDHAVDPGLALNIFPGGRQRGVIGYARTRGWGRWFANNLGFQLGTDLDLTNPTDKLYVGAVFEPVAGLALVGGVSLRKVDVVPQAGALPPLAAMDGTAPTDSRYVVRGYAGITMTLDLLDTIMRFRTDLSKLKQP